MFQRSKRVCCLTWKPCSQGSKQCTSLNSIVLKSSCSFCNYCNCQFLFFAIGGQNWESVFCLFWVSASAMSSSIMYLILGVLSWGQWDVLGQMRREGCFGVAPLTVFPAHLSSSSLSCVPVQHVQPRTEGRVLVRQPLLWCSDTIPPPKWGGTPIAASTTDGPELETAHQPAEIDAPSPLREMSRVENEELKRVQERCACV